MGHSIIITLNGRVLARTSIASNFSRYDHLYPGIYAMHGHKNIEVKGILEKSIAKAAEDGIQPVESDSWGFEDDHKNKELYISCLVKFLQLANTMPDEAKWFSDQVFEIRQIDGKMEGEGGI